MSNKFKDLWKRAVSSLLSFLVAYVGQGLVRLLLLTCRWEVLGVDRFKQVAINNKCILILWHNRLVLAPIILHKYAKTFIFAGMVSKSRDGELVSAVIHSYKAGRTIRVGHQTRHQALVQLIRHLEEKREIVIITPDGPRGPIYKVKPGAAWAAMKTGASVVPLTWSADKFWEFNTWDRLRFPKPFSQITVSFGEPVNFDQENPVSLEEAQDILCDALKGKDDCRNSD